MLPTKRRLKAEQDLANKKARIEEMEQNTRLLRLQAAAASESWRKLEESRRKLQYGQGEIHEDIMLAILKSSAQHIDAIRHTIEQRRDLARPEILMSPVEQREEMKVRAATSRTTLLSLPRELRSQIYEYAMIWGCIHIENNYVGFACSNLNDDCVLSGGTVLTRKLCRLSSDHDHVEGRNWLNKVDSDHYGPCVYETEHQACFYGFDDPNLPLHNQRWPFALLFVCKQTFDDLRKDVYMRNSFSFRGDRNLDAFVHKIPQHNTSLIRDLRLALYMGQTHECFMETIGNSASIRICNAFSGLRKLHLSLEPSFCKIQDWRDTLKSDWKIAHWARFILNLGSLPLEDATVLVLEDEAGPKALHRHFTDRMLQLHRLTEEELREWARKIRDQLVAPWDRESVLQFLREHYDEEVKYHKKVCLAGPWDGQKRALPLPEDRVP